MRELARLAWPITISMVSYALMTLVDTLFVARLGPSALAGVGLGGTAAFCVLVFSFGLLRGVKVLVSQMVGAGRRDEARHQVAAGLAVAAMLGVVTLLAGWVLASQLPSIAATAASGAAAQQYTMVRMLGTPLVLGYVALRESRYGLGDSRSPMVSSVLANLTNIVLDYVFIVILETGVAGAAWATVASDVVGFAMLWRIQRREGFGTLRRSNMSALWRIGLPTALQFLLEFGAFGVLAVMLAALDEQEMAAHQIAIQVIHFTFLPTLAVSEAGSVLAGQAVGARRLDLVPGVAYRTLLLGCAYALVCTLALVGFAGAIASSFTSDAALRDQAMRLLYVAAVFQLADAAQVAARGALRGAGDVRFPAVVGIVTAWICTPPLTWLLGYKLGYGAVGGWLGLCLEIFVGAVILWHRLRSGAWRVAAERAREELDAPAVELATA